MDYTVKTLIEAVETGEISANDARPIFIKIVSRPGLTGFSKGTPEWYEDNDGWDVADDNSSGLMSNAHAVGRLTDAQYNAIVYNEPMTEPRAGC